MMISAKGDDAWVKVTFLSCYGQQAHYVGHAAPTTKSNASHDSYCSKHFNSVSAVDQNFTIEMNLQVNHSPGSDSHLRPSLNISSPREQ